MVWVGKQLWELGRDTSVAVKADAQHDYRLYIVGIQIFIPGLWLCKNLLT